MAVRKVIEGIGGVENVTVDLFRGEAVFEETGPIDLQALKDRIRRAGYEVVD
jgi:copper chaperone